ncbi:HAMP domain-containing sensor histidine kinase [Clostridium sp. A1-XYC3]|uniref:histidine kinase n=1 Tax=Clostridium tanneri TaxID=3037988 RepID=A0ABU4JPA1_9CLOT|nr:HAMP domain-containing sensor histidine kinase [Clostridium sp. A1-XYC3]MDW8799976.1 HAMP domain-containing sensor histidine kinase [Clostridium sp. A1-XYC3]
MKNSVRFKFTFGLSIIFIVSAIALNLLIRQVFDTNLENTIKASMKDIMKNSREYIRYNMISNNPYTDKKDFYSSMWNLLNNSVLTYNYELEIRDSHGKIVESNIGLNSSELVEKGSKSAIEGKAVINLRYSGESVQGILSYPLYQEDKLLGVLNISKNFDNIYSQNKRIIRIITMIEIVVFIFIFIAAYLITSKIINPIIVLTKQIKKIEDGDYEINLDVKSKDEIGLLLNEFVNMKDKIKDQLETIGRERDKVLKLERGRREFFNNVTHELKTPLTAISGYAQLLLDKNVQDKEFRDRAIQRIYLESERLHGLVLDLINVSKGASFLQEDKKVIEMKSLLESICRDMNIKSQKYSLDIVSKIEEGTICGQENKIKQLIINLIDNAIKYSFSEEKIYIYAFNDESNYTVEILNKSNPISEDIYNSIFQPFVKGNNVVEVGSRGLGLYICSEIVKEHNGEIHIENGDEIKVTVKIPSF